MPEAAATGRHRRVLVERKLAPPPLPDRLLERPRLERHLRELVDHHRVVVVSATAGAGKTTTVARVAGMLDRPAAWLSVDRTDAAPGRLVTYVEAALARQLPAVGGTATEALSVGVPHPEAAGLLAEAIGETRLLFVLDDLERLGEHPETWAVIEALLRYAPPNLHFALVSRREIPTHLCALPAGGVTAALPERNLAFTPSEAAEALAMLGEERTDAAAIVEATGGWVTGVLFEAWRSSEHVAGFGGEADPLDGYLSSELLEQLQSEDRDFLVATSVLDEVTPARGAALGQPAAGERLVALRAAHLPVVWGEGGLTMRCHPRFRDYLLKRLERRDADQVAAIRVAHGHLLAGEGHHEEATEEFLRVGALPEALDSAEQAIFAVIERLDFSVAERWLAAFADFASDGVSQLTVAELVIALATDDYRRGARVADRLVERGERERLACASERAAAVMASLYTGTGRLADAHAVLDAAEDGPRVSVARYVMRLYESGSTHPRPGLSGDEMDGVLWYTDYFCGRLAELAEAPLSGWTDAVARPWQIAARSALGHTQAALDLYEAAQDAGVLPVSLGGVVGPDLLIDAGRREQARAAIEHGRNLVLATGARDLQLLSGLIEAKLALRLERDPAAGLAVLARLERDLGARDWPFINGPWNAWRGLALLLSSEDETALVHLRAAVEVMTRADLVLELPTAAVYLAEAEWRCGDEEAADRAADIALEASGRLGSNHRLLQALADFPAVVARRIDAEPGVNSPWHELGRALIVQGVTVPAQVGDSVELREFGKPAVFVNDEQRRPRITKSYELLAYLIGRRGDPAERDELLDALFDGRADDSTRSYLRQAVYWVRRALPENGLILEGRRIQLGASLMLTSESVRFEALLAEAARLRGDARLEATLEALHLFDQGEYLAGARSAWADDRRRELTERATDARCEAAELAFAAGEYGKARELAEDVLRVDQFREMAWRVMMRIANALGDDDGAIVAFNRCEEALAGIGATPSPSTRRLLETLRR